MSSWGGYGRHRLQPSDLRPCVYEQQQDYTRIIRKLNRENEELSRNVIQLSRENARLKTQMQRSPPKSIIKRSPSSSQKSQNPYQKSESPQMMAKIAFPFSTNLQKSPKTEPSTKEKQNHVTFDLDIAPQQGQSNKSSGVFHLGSPHSPSPTFIDELADDKFMRESVSTIRKSRSKGKRGISLSKQLKCVQKVYEDELNTFKLESYRPTINSGSSGIMIKEETQDHIKLESFIKEEKINGKTPTFKADDSFNLSKPSSKVFCLSKVKEDKTEDRKPKICLKKDNSPYLMGSLKPAVNRVETVLVHPIPQSRTYNTGPNRFKYIHQTSKNQLNYEYY